MRVSQVDPGDADAAIFWNIRRKSAEKFGLAAFAGCFRRRC